MRHAPSAVLILALVIAALLRVPGLDVSPPGMFRDELEKGYTALQLWQTGRHGIPGADGVRLSTHAPLFIEVFDGHDRTSAIYQYIAAPFVGLGGLNPWTTRLPAALMGILGVGLAGGLAWRLAGPWAGALTALLLALHPTGVLFSRWAQQGIIQAALVPGGFWLLLEAERCAGRHRRLFSAAGGAVLAIAAYAYVPGRLVVPLLAAAWLGWRLLPSPSRRLVLATLLPGIIAFTALWVPQLIHTLGAGGGRLERIGLAGGGTLLNYTAFWTPAFWIVEGDPNPRHTLPGSGFGGIALTVLAAAAVVRWAFLLGKSRPAALADPALFALAWLLLAPLAAAMTAEGNPHSLRAILLVPGSALLAGTLAAGPIVYPSGRTLRLAVVGALPLLLISGAALTTRGVFLLSRAPGAPWEAGTVESVRYALSKPGTPSLSAEVPYALYVALFAEETDPRVYHREGLAALRTRLLAPGQIPTLHPGDTWITPPRRGLPLHYHASPVVIYERGAEGAFARLPPGKEHLYPEIPGL